MTNTTTQPKKIPAYDASLADMAEHELEPRQFKGLTYPFGDYAPEYGECAEIAPGLGWTRLPVPGSLAHINIWLLDDEDEQGKGKAIVDSGLNMKDSIAAWEKLFAGALKDVRITRVIITHFHPDHVGAAGWLCEKFGVKLWMNRTEWLMARMLTADIREAPPEEAIRQMRRAGWSEERLEKFRERGWGNFARAVSPLPIAHVRLDDGAVHKIGDHDWRVMTGAAIRRNMHACIMKSKNCWWLGIRFCRASPPMSR